MGTGCGQIHDSLHWGGGPRAQYRLCIINIHDSTVRPEKFQQQVVYQYRLLVKWHRKALQHTYIHVHLQCTGTGTL